MRRLLIIAIPLILGIILAITGIAYGASSHQTTYQTTAQNTIAHYLSDGKTGYVQLANSPTPLYVIDENSFTPAIQGSSTFNDGDTVTLVFSPGDATTVDETSTIGTHLQGTAYKVVQITAVTDNSSQTVYSTAEYTAHPQGTYQNSWGIGIGLIIAGLLVALCSLFAFLPRKQSQPAFSAIPPSTPAITPPFSPYQQAYPPMPSYQPQPTPPVRPSRQPPAGYPPPSEQFGAFGPTVEADQTWMEH